MAIPLVRVRALLSTPEELVVLALFVPRLEPLRKRLASPTVPRLSRSAGQYLYLDEAGICLVPRRHNHVV